MLSSLSSGATIRPLSLWALLLFSLCLALPVHGQGRRSRKKTRPAVSQQRFQALHPVTQKKLSAALREMKQRGIRPRVTTTFRSRPEQASLYRCSHKRRCRRQRGIYSAARPGTSLHEAGLAVDVAGVSTGHRRQRRLTGEGRNIVRIMKKHGFSWPYRLKDPVHFEISPKQAGFRSSRTAIRAGQQRWVSGRRTTAAGAQRAAGRRRQAGSGPRLQKVAFQTRPVRHR